MLTTKDGSLLVRLLAPYLLALVAVAFGLYVYGDRAVERLYLQTLEEQVLRQARLAGDLLPWDESGAALDRRCAELGAELGFRLTVVSSDGTVLGDSEAPSANLENHRDRPEVRAAMESGDGSAVRVSASVGRRFLYRAWRQSRDGGQRVVRLAVPAVTIDSERSRIRLAIWGAVLVASLAALIPAWILARRLSDRVTRLAEFSSAVAAGAAPAPLGAEADDILGTLETNLGAMAENLHAQLAGTREEKEKLAAVLRGMVEGVLVLDRGGTIRLANERLARLLRGRADDAIVGQPLIAVSRDPDLLALVREVTRGAHAEPLVREITFERPRHETVRVTATKIGPADGDSARYILVFHDITELKRLELTRRDFVANVSHELRTPLTAIRGYAEALQGGALEDPQLRAKFVGIIGRHSERLGRLLDDLLTISDLELGRAALRRAPISVIPIVEASAELLRDKAERGVVEIALQVPDGLPFVLADSDRVEQVLVNLLDNAVKYTPSGGRVTIAARAVDALPEELLVPPAEGGRGPWVELSVSDSGAGVPAADLPRLTERFFRVDRARSQELGGTGLGLAIVKHIIQAHGGGMSIRSRLGEGTRVAVYLPQAA